MFLQEGIDSEALAALGNEELKELGVLRMGDRAKVYCPALHSHLSFPDVFLLAFHSAELHEQFSARASCLP